MSDLDPVVTQHYSAGLGVDATVSDEWRKTTKLPFQTRSFWKCHSISPASRS